MAELSGVALDDKYTLDSGRIFVTGIQALVRLPLAQRQRDLAAGLNTAGYVTGYRGSPLGTYDQQLARAKEHLDAHHIVHQPGVNEDLAATACAGTQQVGLDGESRYDGVFAIWYAKGPGVDRSGDAIRHGNLFGTAEHGGVLLLLGDDHICESSTTAHHSEYAMVDAMVPVLNPAGVQEILEYGLLGIAMSRFTGGWVALKCIHDTVESTASIPVDPFRPTVELPADYVPPPDGLNLRWPDNGLGQRMLSPPAGSSKSSGRRISGRAGSIAIEAVLSTVSWTHFNATQPPVKRDMAIPSRPYSRISCTPAGLRTGTSASTIAYSLWCAVVLDSQIWSSPSSISTPPCAAVPNRLPWRIASPERSTPGPLAYQIENTPS